MTRRFVLSMLGAIVCIAWAVLTAWAFVHAATRRDDDVPDVQPWDQRTVTLSDNVARFTTMPPPTSWTI